MGWKDWPYWLKGGFTGLFIIVLIFLLNIFLDLIEGKVLFGGEGNMLFFYFASGPALFIFSSLDKPSIGPMAFIIYLLFTLLEYLIIGILIGWIVGKFKSKNVQ